MRYYTVIVRLSGALSSAVAVEWTNQPAPVDSGQGWEPCLRQADGSWRFSSHDPLGANQPHRRDPGPFAGLAIRYRLSAAGPWSAASADRKEIVILADPGPDPLPVAPRLVTAPTLAGLGKIGLEVTAAPGLWSGVYAPQIAFQWRRDGTAVPGAVARAYVPGPADDLTNLDCAVTASNAAGLVTAITAALPVTYRAPVAVDDLPEEIFDEGTGPQLVETAFAFAGENLSFAATGGVIDVRTGVLAVSTDAPVSGVTVTVTATNSGGSTARTLRITVEAAPQEVAPPALAAADMTFVGSLWRPAGQTALFTPVLAFPGLAGETVAAIEWTTSTAAAPLESHWEIATPKDGAPGRYELFMRDPAKRDPLADPKVDFAVFGLSAAEAARSGRLRFRWRRTATGLWSGPSAMRPVSPAPALTAIPAQQIARNATATLDVAAQATGSGLTFGVRATPAAPWIAIDAATGRLTMTEPGNLAYPAAFEVTVTVAEALGQTATATFALTARDNAASDRDRVWRQLHYREKAIFDLPADHPRYYTRGRYWGEGFQIAHCFEREADRVAFGGDMCGFRLSDDGGATWYWPRGATVPSDGLRGCVFHAIGIDPTDRDVMLVAVGPSNFSPNYASGGAKAIYRTTNGGKTFVPVQAMDDLTDRSNINLSLICCVRSAGTPTTRRWRFIETGGASARYWRSATGGQTWTLGPAFPSELGSATIYGVTQHPTSADTLLIHSSAGLWRTVNDGGLWTRIGNAAGRLSGDVRALWIDPDSPSTMLASMSGGAGGVFHTNNGGATGADWSVALAAAGDVSAASMAVGPKDANNRRTIYLMNDRNDVGHKRPWIQHWLTTGAPSTTKVGQLATSAVAPNGQWFLPRVSGAAAGVSEAHWTEICGRGQSAFAPDPVNPDRCAAFGYALPWRTENRGATWINSNAGFGGMNSQGIAFDSSNPNRMIFALNDVQAAHTENLPDYMEEAKLTPGQRSAMQAQANYDNTGAHGKHAVIVPGHASVPAAKRGRILASIGNYAGGQCIFRKDRTSTGWAADWTNVTTEIQNVPEFFVCAANPNVIYVGTNRSLDAGDSFANALGAKACGVSQQNPAVVFATSDDKTIRRSASYGNASAGAGAAINGVAGAAWTNWFVGTRTKAAVERKTFFWLSPHDDSRAVVQSDAGDLVLIEGAATATIKLQMNLAGAYAALGYSGVLPINVASAEWCPLEPRRFYFHAKMFGRPMVWRATFDAGFTAVTWEDITRNTPTTANNRQLTVHPRTGDVFISNGGGIWVLPAPEALRGDSIWSLLPRPFPSDGTY